MDTACDYAKFFKEFYFLLLKHFEPFLSVSRIDKISFYELFIFDYSTIRLFSQELKGLGPNPKDEGQKKGGLKVPMLTPSRHGKDLFPYLFRKIKHYLNKSKSCVYRLNSRCKRLFQILNRTIYKNIQ